MQTPTQTAKPHHWILAAACVLLLALLATWRLVDDPDAFWHLATGQRVWQHGPWLPVDDASWTFAGQPWLGKDALADGLLAAMAAGGYGTLAVGLALVLLVGALGLAYRVTLPVWLLASGLWLSAIEITATPRSRIFSTALLLPLLAAIDHARQRDRTWILPGLLAGLTLLLHRGGVVGLAILGLAVLLEGVENGRWRHPLTGLGVALGLGLLHPDGPRVWTTVLHVAGSDAYRQRVSEFQPMTFDQAWAAFPVTVVMALLALPVVLPALQPRGNPDLRWRGLVLLVTLLVAGRSPRGMPLLAGAATFAVLPMLDRLMRVMRQTWLQFALALTLSLALVHGQATRPFGVGEETRTLPVAAVRFATAHHLPARVANPLHLGGYLMRAGIPTFIDGRNDQVFPESFFLAAADAGHDPAAFARLSQKYPFTWVLAANPGPGEAFTFLTHDPAWQLVFWSEPAAIYLPRDPTPVVPPYTLFDAADPVGSIQRATANPATVEAILQELQRLVAQDPDGVAQRVWLVMHLHLRGPAFRPQRDEALAQLLARHRDAPEVRQLLGILKIRLP